jgi:glycosyltransferase involved in cell wall biosynthesis
MKINRTAKPLVSIVMASYMHSEFIEEAIRSVINQSFENWELVITDDASSDATVEVIRSIPDRRIRLNVLQVNVGGSAALNDAVLRSRGSLIAVLNSDDVFTSERLSEQVEIFRQNPNINVLFGCPSFIDHLSQPLLDYPSPFISPDGGHPKSTTEWLRFFFDNGNALCHPTLIMRRSVYQTIGLYDPRLAQVPDLDMWIRTSIRYTIHLTNQVVTKFRILNDSKNASALRADTVTRDLWERAKVLRHYLKLSDNALARIFPEITFDKEEFKVNFFKFVLERPQLYYKQFALEGWYQTLGANHLAFNSSKLDKEIQPSYIDFINQTGSEDIHQLRTRLYAL